jgi:ABC-type transport system involved in multi-copper enzyme maturation permease subunit
MLLLIVRKEILNNILSFRFIVTYGLLFCLVMLAMFLMTNEHADRMREARAQETKAHEEIERLAAVEDPGEQFQQMQRTTLYGTRFPSSMSILAKGVEGGLPVQVSTRSFSFFSGRGEERLGRNMLFEVFQTPDLVYVVNVVMSLLALLFVFDAICGEKERGVLKLLMANSVPRDVVLLGKWIGGFVSVAAPFAVAVLGGFVYIQLSGATDHDAEGLRRFWLIFALALLYISACFTLGLMISAATHRTATALLVSLLVWIVWILVVPNIAPVAARLMRPVPAAQVISAEKQAIDREAQAQIAGISKRKVYGDREETERLQREAQAEKAKLDKFARDKLDEQVELTKNLARLSPSASFLLAATRLAGTGPDLYGRFSRGQRRFQRDFGEYIQGFWRNQGQVEWTQNGPKMKDPDWFKPEELPRFRLVSENVGDSFDAALFDVLLLVVYNVLFFMLAYIFFLRYDVT